MKAFQKAGQSRRIMSVAGVSMSQKRRISDKWSSGPCIAFLGSEESKGVGRRNRKPTTCKDGVIYASQVGKY